MAHCSRLRISVALVFMAWRAGLTPTSCQRLDDRLAARRCDVPVPRGCVTARSFQPRKVMVTMIDKKIAFVGAGQMAVALARGFVAAGLCRGDQILAYDPSPEAAQRFAGTADGIELQASNRQSVEQAGIVLLAVKPQQLRAVAEEIRGALHEQQLVVSIAAGVGLAKLTTWLGTERLVRVMPNTPCLVGKGASAFALGPGATEADAALVQQMMTSVGLAFQVQEPYMDCVTGLSGSGPAYVYLLIEALADGGVRAGMPRHMALALAAHTVRGAAEMVVSEQEHPAVLKDRVTSPGGTTIAGLQVLEERGVRAAAMAAVMAATERSRELGQAD